MPNEEYVPDPIRVWESLSCFLEKYLENTT